MAEENVSVFDAKDRLAKRQVVRSGEDLKIDSLHLM